MSLHGKDRTPDLSVLVDGNAAIMEMLQNLTSENPAHIIYTTKQLQERLGVSDKTILKWRNEGILTFSKVFGVFFYTLESVLEMLEHCKIKAVYSSRELSRVA